MPPKKKHRNDDVIDLYNNDDDEKPLVVNLTNDNASDGKMSDHDDSNPGTNVDNKKMPPI